MLSKCPASTFILMEAFEVVVKIFNICLLIGLNFEVYDIM